MRKHLFAAFLAVVAAVSWGLGGVVGKAMADATSTETVKPAEHTVNAVSFSMCGLVEYIVITLDSKTYLLRARDMENNPDLSEFVAKVMATMQANKTPALNIKLDKELRYYGFKCTEA